MKAAIYARVSTPESEHKQDTDNQLAPLLEFLKRHDWTLFKSYVDYITAKTGKKRPSLDQLLADASKMKFDVVVVWKLDRFARSMSDFIRLVEHLDKYRIRFLTVTQPIDTDQQSASGRLFMHIMAAFAEFERELIRERIQASIANRRSKGLPIGKPRIDTNMEQIISLRKSGLSNRKIGEMMNINRMIVLRRLKEYEKLTGHSITKEIESDIAYDVENDEMVWE
jgi:putative DNA-invertase from lambdoid prophage Rac